MAMKYEKPGDIPNDVIVEAVSEARRLRNGLGAGVVDIAWVLSDLTIDLDAPGYSDGPADVKPYAVQQAARRAAMRGRLESVGDDYWRVG
jgi:hypothetical protein